MVITTNGTRPALSWWALGLGLLAALVLCAEAALPGQPYASYWHPATLLTWNLSANADVPYNRATVPLATRFLNPALNVNSHARSNEARVVSLVAFGPTSGSPSQGSLAMHYYALNYWQYLDTLVFWGGSASEGLILAPNATVINAAHRNGVPVLGNVFLPPTAYGGQLQWVRDLVQKSGATYPVADKMIQVANAYGFDGWFINQETAGGDAALAAEMREFTRYLRTNSTLKVMWYDAMTESGSVSWQNALTTANDWFLQYNGRVADTMFLNFWWSASGLSSSRSRAQTLGASPYDLFAGIDVEGGGYDTSVNWTDLFPEGSAHVVSLGFYRPEWTFNYSSGPADFYARDNRFWVGPNGDPVNTSTTNAWKGVAHYVPPMSPVNRMPFVTSFNTGHGSRYAVNGVVRRVRDWNNLSLQDILPTWRWRQQTTGARLVTDFSWSEAFEGGSSLKISGTLNATNDIPLYAASLAISNNTSLRVAFKTGTAASLTRAKIAIAYEDLPGTFQYLDLGTAVSSDWNTRTFSLGAAAGRKLAVLGLRCEAASAVSNYVLRVGQLALYHGAISTPQPPTGVYLEQLNFVDGSNATARVRWTAAPGSIQAYHLYRRNPDNTLTHLGSTPGTAFFIPEIVRLGNEGSTLLEVESVSPDYGYSAHATVEFLWEPASILYTRGIGSTWKHLDTGANLGTAWRDLAYNDAAWASGAAQLGFGDGDESGLVASNRQMTTYFRRTFPASASACSNLTVRLLRDDGGVVYLNGVEVFRSNLPDGSINYLTPATNALAADESTIFYSTNLPGNLLVNGTNILAVEIHQNANNSSDLSFALELIGRPSGAAPLLSLANDRPATNLTFTTASLGGTILSLNADPAEVIVYYGPADGGTNAAAWTNSARLSGVGLGAFALTASNLYPGATYYYRAMASNRYAAAWAPASATFATARASAISLIPLGAIWKYLDNGSDQGTAWRQLNFADSAWASGPAELGYDTATPPDSHYPATVVGYGPSTTNKYITTYFRRAFLVPDPARVQGLTARLQRDDGAVVYLNGTEVWRDNLPLTGLITNTTLASSAISGAGETALYTNRLPAALLVPGTNLLAVEIHQNLPSSSDIDFNFALDAAVDLSAPSSLSLDAIAPGQLRLSGSAATAFYQLYASTNAAAPGSWTNVTYSLQWSNGQWYIPLPAPAARQQFFQMRRP